MSDPRTRTLITAAELAARLDARAPVVLLDVSDDLAIAPVDRSFIPGAFAVCLATDFSGTPSKLLGKRPLPNIGDLEAKVNRWGVKSDTLVVPYDSSAGAQASRAWWTLRWAGVENVRILDGGLQAWVAFGRSVENQAAAEVGGGNIVLRAGCMPTIDADEAATLARQALLLDARGRAAYLGAPAEPGKPASGHIPGSVSAPSGEHITANGCFKSTEDLCARFAEIGVDCTRPLGVYCGSGNAASHLLAALSVAGIEAPLYVGSWSAWSADPTRAVAIGPERG